MEFHQAFIRLRSTSTGEWFVHPDLRGRLIADAGGKESNLSVVAMRILADRHGVAYEPSRRKTEPKEDPEFLTLRLPWPLYTTIATNALARGKSYTDAIRADLCAHYDLEIPGRAAAAA